jgi:two-component system sensor histidine kinase/response regulator
MTGPKSENAQPHPIDYDEALERLEGDRELLRELLDLFREDYPRQKAELESALERREAEAVRQTAHSLKGAAANLSLKPFREAALSLETAAREGAWEEMISQAGRLQSEFDRLVEHLASGRAPDGRATPGPAARPSGPKKKLRDS